MMVFALSFCISCFSIFSCDVMEEAYSFLISERKGVDGDGKGGGEDVGTVEKRKTI